MLVVLINSVFCAYNREMTSIPPLIRAPVIGEAEINNCIRPLGVFMARSIRNLGVTEQNRASCLETTMIQKHNLARIIKAVRKVCANSAKDEDGSLFANEIQNLRIYREMMLDLQKGIDGLPMPRVKDKYRIAYQKIEAGTDKLEEYLRREIRFQEFCEESNIMHRWPCTETRELWNLFESILDKYQVS